MSFFFIPHNEYYFLVLILNALSFQADHCPSCRRKLPRCAICLFSVGLVNEDDREMALASGLIDNGLFPFSVH